MLMSEDDDEEPQLNVVDNYYLVDALDQPVCFSILPFQFQDKDQVPDCKKDVFLWGTADPGIKVYKKAVAWKLGLEGKQPEVSVLSSEGSWISLKKPKNSYQETIRTILITVQMLHFVRKKPEDAEKNLWNHLRRVFDKFEVRPSEDDLRNHHSLIKQFAEKDSALANSQILQGFIGEKSRKKTSEAGLDKVEVKVPFIVDDEDIEEMADVDNNVESDEEEDDDLFDAICAICDNGGDLLCCDGPCMRSFHAKIGTGEDSYCDTLGYTEAEVQAMKNFLCKNCEHKQHQCFICQVLEPSDGPTAKVFLCNNATCGHFYHPKCVAQQLHSKNKNEALELEMKIANGFSFTCPIHWCFRCKGLEDRTQEQLQFAVCRRCPKSYHRKCLPREISFEDNEDEDAITRAWELEKRILIYCLKHEIDSDIDTPVRDHIKFPRIPKIEKPTGFLKKMSNVVVKNKKRPFSESVLGQLSLEPAKLSHKVRVIESAHSGKIAVRSSSEKLADEPEKKKTKFLEDRTRPEPYLVKDASTSRPKPAKEQEKSSVAVPSATTRKIPQSSFPKVDSETVKRVNALMEKEVPSLTLRDVSKKCMIPSTHAYSGRQIDRIIATGKLERSVQALGAALKTLENGGSNNDAKAVCEPEVIRQLVRWHSKLRVYMSPFIYGTRYSSFGRHFTKEEKLVEIVEKLHLYVEPGDTIVDFCCGANDFSRLMKQKLDEVQKKCHFKNFDLIQPQNCFSFERRDWMTVQTNELPHGSKLIMGLNPPFGVKAALANKFIDKALTFKPKLVILIVPKETKRLDQKKAPYDLIWEDSQCLSGKAFYLPGSVDVNDKAVEGWNASTPPLYLWSRPDWTKKHMKVAEEHGHRSVGKIARSIKEDISDDLVMEGVEASGLHTKSEKEDNIGKTSVNLRGSNLSDLPVRIQTKGANKQNARSGKEEGTTEKRSYSVSLSDDCPVNKQHRSGDEKSKQCNLSNNLPLKKQAESTSQPISQSGKEKENGRDKKEREYNMPSNLLLKNQSENTFQPISRSGKKKEIVRNESRSSHDRSMKRSTDQVDGGLPPEKQLEVAYEEKMNSPIRKSIHQEKQDAYCEDGVIAHREKSRTYQHKYTQRGADISGASFKETGDSDMSISPTNTGNVPDKSRSCSPFIPSEHTSDRIGYPESYMSYPTKEHDVSLFNRATYQRSYLASHDKYEGKEDPPFHTNVNDIARKYDSSIEVTKQYASAPTADAYGMRSFGDRASLYRRQSSEECNIKSADWNLQTSQYSLGSSGARYAQPSLTSAHGISATSAPYSSVMDRYAPDYLGPSAQRSSVMDKYAAGLGPSAPGSSVMDRYAPALGPNASGSSVMDRYALGLGPNPPGSSVMDRYARGLGPNAPGSSVMDRYAPPLEETNYPARGVPQYPGSYGGGWPHN